MRTLLFLASIGALYVSITTASELSAHSTNLVNMFRDYLVNMEAEQNVNHLRKRAADEPKNIKICGGRKDCGRVVQNFGILYDPNSAMAMCKNTYYFQDAPKKSGIRCYDKSPSCKILRDEFAMCLKPEVVDDLGCHLTCGYCKPVPAYGSRTS